MHPTTAELFAETIEKTGHWIDDLMNEARTSDPRQAYSILRAVLHVLRDRLTVNEAVNLGAQLPLLIRGFYYDGWRPEGRSAKFQVLSRHVTEGEICHVRDQLPAEVRDLWQPARIRDRPCV